MIPLDFLVSSQNLDGGWGYKRNGMSFVEPTAAVLLALAAIGQNAASPYTRGTDFLRKLQRPDGGWGIAALDAESGWMTAWAAWALARSDSAAAARGAEWLLSTEGLRTTNPADVEGIRRLLKIDASLIGWPWQTGDAAWIFPTGLALLALHALGQDAHPRVQEGIKFVFDRAIPSGGWNIGNPSMLGAELPATIINTALVLIAMGDFSISNETTARAYAWLGTHMEQAQTAPELAWGLWAWQRAKLEAEQPTTRLKALERADGSWDGNPFTTAVALLGLGSV